MAVDDEGAKAAASVAAQLAPHLYKDLAQPAARRMGSALDTLFKVGLAPVAMLDWGFERTGAWLKAKLEERLETIPEDCRVPPPVNIAVGAVTRIAAACDSPELRNLYAELLLKAMDTRTQALVHPAFLTVIEQLSPQEALVFVSLAPDRAKAFFVETITQFSRDVHTVEAQFEAHCRTIRMSHAEQAGVWLDNLKRLGLLRLAEYDEVSLERERQGVRTTSHRHLEITAFGEGFLQACGPTTPVAPVPAQDSGPAA